MTFRNKRKAGAILRQKKCKSTAFALRYPCYLEKTYKNDIFVTQQNCNIKVFLFTILLVF